MAPFTWTVLGGELPTGLNLSASGVLSGTPTTPGEFDFTVQVTDSSTPLPQTGTAAYSINVAAVKPQPPTNVVATAGNASASVSFTAPSPTGIATGGDPLKATGAFTVTVNTTGTPVAPVTCDASPCNVTGLANNTQYSFTVTATNTAPLTSDASDVSNTVRPGVNAQTITFNQPADQTFGTSPTLTASASSLLPVSFTSSTPSVCTVTTAGALTFVGIGSCTINADQTGGTNDYASAPRVTRTFQVVQATPTVTVTSNATGNTSVTGQPLSFTATLTNPTTTTGTVTWTVNNVAGVGTTTALNANGVATFTPNPALPVGTYTVKASYGGDTNHAAESGQLTQVVGKANTTTTVQVSGNTLTATVAPVAPGAGTPTGTVAFTVAGVAAGSAPLTNGVATLTASTTVGNQAVAATYSGDSGFNTSTGNRTPIGPTVTSHITSAHAKHNGWYRSAVHVSFTCTPNTAPLSAAGCPAERTVSHNGAGQFVTVTVTQTDGGTTTVTVSPINIDKTPPKLSVKVHKDHSLTCHTSDSLSHGASCHITRHSTTKRGVRTVHWTATAHDRAGNTATKHGHFSYVV